MRTLNVAAAAATLFNYDPLNGILQEQKKITMRQTGLSRTCLVPGREYNFRKVEIKLGPEQELILAGPRFFESTSVKGMVLHENPFETEHSPNLQYELAIKAGASAFVACRDFQVPNNNVYPIPAFIIDPPTSPACFYTIRLDEVVSTNDDNGEKPSSTPAVSSPFSKWIQSNNVTVSPEVIQKWERCGVRTVEDAAVMFLDQEEAKHAKMLAARRDAQQAAASRVLLSKNFRTKDIGVGGVGEDFEVVFRRLFTSRMFSPAKLQALGITHVKGLILSGPPGCGKTLLAHRLSTLLRTCQTTVLYGPEVYHLWAGNSEENVRNLFKDAEAEWKAKGENSALHVVIIDEIDALCGRRGSSSQRATDSIVSQFLARMDGTKQINNILLIGLTNRIHMIDPALLRPGRFELQLELKLPDKAGRLEILEIHTRTMRTQGIMDDATAASLPNIAKATKGFSGAELESLVKGACSLAMDRCLDQSDSSSPPDESKIKLQPSDFQGALQVVRRNKNG